MKKYNVLVTGVGAIIGYGIVRALRNCRYEVHISGMDIYPDAIGQRWCDNFFRSLLASDPGYGSFLAEIIKKHQIDLVFFGIEQEIHRLCDIGSAFPGDQERLILNNRNLIELSRDKWLLHKHLVANGFKAILSLVDGEYEEAAAQLGIPCLVKPRDSMASKGIALIESREDYDYWKHKLGRTFMVQEIIGDDNHEYTVGAFGLGDGTISQSITFLRRLSREGSTVKAKTVDIPELDAEVRHLAALLKPIGPTNFQFRLHRGDYLLLEVNPRFSSSLSLRTAFGFNEPEMCLDYFGEKKRPVQVTILSGTAVRYIEDTITFS